MPIQIENTYYVGKDQPYTTVNQAINTISAALGGDYILPPGTAPDGGQINVVIKGGGKFPSFAIPDNMTQPLLAANRYLVIRRQEYLENGTLITDALPVISPMAENGGEIAEEDKLIGINLGSNNPNVKLSGLRINGFVIGLSASFNCDNLYISRCFFTNSVNAQVYIHDCDNVYLTNNIVVGGQYGVVCKFIKALRFYHNTVFLDGLTAIDGMTKAGVILQGERTFNNITPSTLYCLGNIIYTIGCPAAIFYDEDLKTNRLVSNYNNFYSQTTLVQLRQDNATLPQDTAEIIKFNLTDLISWRQAGPLGSDVTLSVDQNSISVHPLFIQNISLLSSSLSSIINLNALENSPVLQKVPAWYFISDSFYIPDDFDTDLIAVDSLLNTRQQPLTAIGCNDAVSINGFFGQDIFTSPLDLDPDKKCDLDPLDIISSQELTMNYPAINAGYFWSHERPYYLYGKKGAFPLGYLARTVFKLPGFLDIKKPITISARDKEIPEDDWDLAGRLLILYHRNNKITSYSDEIQIQGQVKAWYDNGFTYEDAYYIFKISDGETDFVLPASYQPNSPVVITDDRVSYTNPIDAVYREFTVEFNEETNESIIVFGGNDNLVENGDFTYTFSGLTPSYWVTKPQTGTQPSVFMLSNHYSYFGDRAVAIGITEANGYITSSKIPISQDEVIALSWHAKLPIDITGSTGQAISEITGYYNITFFDNYDEQIQTEVDGSFVINNDYQRYYISLGTSDIVVASNISGVASAPLVSLSETPLVLPANVTKLEFTLSGANYSGQVSPSAFYILDAVQAEYASEPSYYHPKPSFGLMTVEFETDPSGVFIDKRLNITPVFNENPNGFLYISDMPATIWDGPSDPEVTTLHEYRWPHGRINLLPWGRLFGKDKLHQKAILNDKLQEPLDILVPYVFPRKASEAVITPSVIRMSQEAELSDGFSVQIIDDIGNPYGLRNYVAHIYDDKGNFPGWLSKKYYGAKEQLGSTIYGSLNSNGSFGAFYLSPSSNHIRYVGFVPTLLTPVSGLSGSIDTIGTIRTAYNVSLENNGNITVIGQSGKVHSTLGSVRQSNEYFPSSNGNKMYIVLEYPPVFGSLMLSIDSVPYTETQTTPQSNEFLVDYSLAQVQLAAGVAADVPVSISYQPKYVYPNPNQPDTITIHTNRVFSGYSGPIQVDYDAEVKMEVRISDPLDREFVATFPIILQNPQLSKIKNQNVSFEF